MSAFAGAAYGKAKLNAANAASETTILRIVASFGVMPIHNSQMTKAFRPMS
jgi:hypothetical protein